MKKAIGILLILIGVSLMFILKVGPISIKRSILFLMLSLLLPLNSCGLNDKSYPEEVFEKVKLNSNKIPESFKKHFIEIRAHLKAGNLVIVTQQNEVRKINATEYVANHYVHLFDEDITDIKELKPDAETKNILAAALDMFRYADDIYKTDFPRIAKMIDDGKPDKEINAAIDELDRTKGPIMNEKYDKVHYMILPYANKHGIKYKILETPDLVNYK